MKFTGSRKSVFQSILLHVVLGDSLPINPCIKLASAFNLLLTPFQVLSVEQLKPFQKKCCVCGSKSE